jgi:hypothetical protein
MAVLLLVQSQLVEKTIHGRDIDTVPGKMPNMPKAAVFTYVGE